MAPRRSQPSADTSTNSEENPFLCVRSGDDGAIGKALVGVQQVLAKVQAFNERKARAKRCKLIKASAVV